MWGKQGHAELRGQICSGAAGAQQLRAQGRGEQERSRAARLRAGTGRCVGTGEGGEQCALCLGRRRLLWVRRVKAQAAEW